MQLDLQSLTSMPFAQPHFFCEKITRDPNDAAHEELWFIFKDSKLLVNQDGQPLQAKELPLKHSVYLGVLDHLHIYAGEAVDAQIPYTSSWEDIRSLVGKLDETLLALAGKASQLILWERTHQFCGQCGHPTTKKKAGARQGMSDMPTPFLP